MTLGIPGSPGVPQEIAALTVSLPYNDLNPVQQLFNENGRQIAALIVEPVAATWVVPPRPGFLEGLRKITSQSGSLSNFDEVITGFRVALGGAQELFKIRPDLTCLGKIIGGGCPWGRTVDGRKSCPGSPRSARCTRPEPSRKSPSHGRRPDDLESFVGKRGLPTTGRKVGLFLRETGSYRPKSGAPFPGNPRRFYGQLLFHP